MVKCAGQYLLKCPLFVYSELSVCRYYCPVEIVLNSYHVFLKRGFMLFFFFWLCWVYALHRFFSSLGEQGLLSSRRAWASHCGGFSYGARVPEHRLKSCGTHRLGCSMVCGVFLDQGSNPCPLHWWAGSLPLSHLGSSNYQLLKELVCSTQQNFIDVILKVLTLLGFCIFMMEEI